MLSNNTFLEARIHRLLDGLSFVENGLGVHVQRMLKMNRSLYTGGNFFAKYLEKKATEARKKSIEYIFSLYLLPTMHTNYFVTQNV